MSDFIEIPMFDENLKSVMKKHFIVKQYIKGDPFINRPYKTAIVSYVDAESCQGKTEEDNDGKVIRFECNRCKKMFKADKAHAIHIHLSSAPLGDGSSILSYNYERAYCGRCYKKAEKLAEQIYKAICDFDLTQVINHEMQ